MILTRFGDAVMKFRYLNIFILIIVYLISIEIALEYRAIERGRSPHFLSKFIKKSKIQNKNNVFPYRSLPVELLKQDGVERFWMASASYAEDSKRKINELFPNIFCAKLDEAGNNCQMINAAKAGFTINDNITQIKDDAVKWKPDYIILYSMNLDINTLSYQFLGGKSSVIKLAQKIGDDKNNKPIEKFVESEIEHTTTYNHLRRYFGGTVLLSSFLYNDIGDDAAVAFKETLERFIHACVAIGAKPVLVTFATRYDQSNISEITYDEKLWFVRYDEYLSPKGWVDTVARYNEIIRQTAKQNNIICIDVGKALAGKKQYFTDFVHFTKEGHVLVGQILADGFLHANHNLANLQP